MDGTHAAFWMEIAGMICWIVCFVWMGRISAKQNSLLDQLTEQGRRIEMLSKIEHDLIKEVHPQVGEIKENMEAVITTMKENTEEVKAASKLAEEAANAAPAQPLNPGDAKSS